MSRNFYALLVGINQYPGSIPPLRGSRNDVAACMDYLAACIDPQQFTLHIRTLQDQAATREALIAGFREHLGQAVADDIVLFFFSGHGSQTPTSPDLRIFDPDHQDETLVCWDSRLPGSHDLVDKELAFLIAEVAVYDPHIVVILDCCHSGSGTRQEQPDMSARGIEMDLRERPADSFLVYQPMQIPSTSRSVTVSPAIQPIPLGRHILLAACQDRELAYEYRAEGVVRGGFSYFLFNMLGKARTALTYRDLFKQTATQVRNRLPQSPRLEATHGADQDATVFAGAFMPRSAYFMASYDRKSGWIIDAGAIHGIPPITDGKTILALFPGDAHPEQLRNPHRALGTVHVVEVLPQHSCIEESDFLAKSNLETTYKAVIRSVPLARLKVSLMGETTGVQLLHQILSRDSWEHPVVARVALVDQERADVQILAHSGSYTIRSNDAPTTVTVAGFTQSSAATVVEQLDQIAHWYALVRLANPLPLHLRADDVTLAMTQFVQQTPHGAETIRTWPDVGDATANVQMSYTRRGAVWREPTFEVRVVSRIQALPIYCALLALSDDYTVTSLLPGGTIRLESNASIAVRLGANVTDSLWNAGITETTHLLKLIVCTADFDAALLERRSLFTRQIGERDVPRLSGAFAQLIDQYGQRGITALPDNEERSEDWLTKMITITIARPRPGEAAVC